MTGTVDCGTERWVLAATILASSMAFIDGSALNVALPALQASLHASGAQLLWIVNGYLLMLAGFLYWRLFIFTSVRRATSVSVLLSDYASSPLLSFAQVVSGYIKDLFETAVLAWFVLRKLKPPVKEKPASPAAVLPAAAKKEPVLV